jgi:drug/metabolite transporter (DMT)-like permease
MTDAGARLRIVAAAALFSTGGAAIKATTLTAWQVASLRSGVAALALLLLARGARGRWTRGMMGVAAAYAATLVTFVTANKLTTSANAIFLQSTSPLYIVLLAPWLLGERLTRRDVQFVIVAAAGLLMFFLDAPAPTGTAPQPEAGNLVAGASGLTWALTVMGLRWVARTDARPDAALGAALAGNIVAFAACLPMALPLPLASPGDWAAIGYLGVFQIGLAYVFLSAAVKKLPALEVSLLLLLEPVLNPIWAWLVHGERPGPWSVAGGVLILAATAVKSTWEARRNSGD